MPNGDEALLSPSDIARLAGVSPAAVSNWRQRSVDFPKPKGGTGPRPLFSQSDVIAWMKANGKGLVERGVANAVAAMNLIVETGRGTDLEQDEAARLILAMLSARKLSDESDHAMPVWESFLQVCGAEGVGALRDLGSAYEIPRWDDLVELPDFAEGLSPQVVEKIAGLVDDVPRSEFVAAGDAVLNRALSARGRAGSEHGYVGSRISTFLARIGVEYASGRVYDPACGYGDVLMQLVDQLGEKRLPWMVAHDVNLDAVVVAEQRGFLRDARLELDQVDVLAGDPMGDRQADLILVEPPLGLRYKDYDLADPRWAYGMPSAASSEFAWLQHAIAHLTDDGIAFVVTPGSTLTSARHAETRRRLVAAGCVRAIYQLPPKMLQHLSIPLTVWVLGRPADVDTVRFVDAISDEVVTDRAEFESTNPNADISISDVLDGDANLLPQRWIGLDTPDPETVRAEYRTAVAGVAALVGTAAETDVREFEMAPAARVDTVGGLRRLGVVEVHKGRHVTNRRDPRLVKAVDIVHGDLPKLRAGSPGSPASLASPEPPVADDRDQTKSGDVLVATIGQLAALLDELGGHLLGTGVVALRVKNPQLRPDYLAAVLNGKWNRRFFTGATIQRVSVSDLEVPVLPLGDQEAFANTAADLRNVIRIAYQLQSASALALESLTEVVRYGGEVAE